MGKNGLGRKLVVAAAAVGTILLVLRIVGGRGSEDVDEDGEGAIDRVDTGHSDDDGDGDGDGGPLETGLERVSTDDEEAAETETAETKTETADSDAGTDEEDAESDQEDDEVPVEATRGRFDDLDLFDVVAIVGAAFEAGREEYRNRT